MYTCYRARVRHVKHEPDSPDFPLTHDMIKRKLLIQGFQCLYCDRYLRTAAGKGLNGSFKNWTATLERVDELIGYRDDNVVITCYGCNTSASGQMEGAKQNHCARFGSLTQFNRLLEVAICNTLSD